MPTGSGKTVIFAHMLKLGLDLHKDKLKALVLLNRIKLVDQSNEKIKEIAGTEVGIYCGSIEKNNNLQITTASIDSVINNPSEFKDYNIVIIDEAHNFIGAKKYHAFIKSLEVNPKTKFCWFTATPWRCDFIDSGMIYGSEGIPLNGPSFKLELNFLIKEGYLVPPIFRSVKGSFNTSGLKLSRGDFKERDIIKLTQDEIIIKSQVEDALSRMVDRKKIIWACTCIKHAEKVREMIELYEPCDIVHSKLKNSQELIKGFEINTTRHITSVVMVSEGFDFPPLDCVVIMRPTRSPRLYVQLIGRGLRLFEGKRNCLVLDYGGAVQALGDPNNPKIRTKGSRSESVRACLECDKCEAVIFKFPCAECGHQREIKLIDKIGQLTISAYDKGQTPVMVNKKELKVISHSIDLNYISASGNGCKVITFHTMMIPVKKYYMKKSWRSMEEFDNDFRLISGNDLSITVQKREGYWSVVEINKISGGLDASRSLAK